MNYDFTDEELGYGTLNTSVSPETQEKRDLTRLNILKEEKKKETDPTVIAALDKEITDTSKKLAKTGNYSVEDLVREVNIPSDMPIVSVDPKIGSDTKGGLRSTIADLAEMADKQYQNIASASSTLSDRIRENIKKQMAGLRKEGELSATMKLEEFQLASAKAGENAAQLSRLGLNTSDLDSVVAEISTNLTESYRRAQAMRADIAERQSVGPLDNPIDWIINQFTLPKDIRTHNAIIRQMQADKQFVDQATSIAQSVQHVNAAKYTPITLQGAQAAAELARQTAEDKATALEDKLLTVDFNKQVQLLNVIQGRISNINAMAAEEERSQARQTVREAKAREEERKKLDDAAVKTSAMMLGLEVPDRKSLDKLPKDLKDAVEYIMANGGVVGKDPLEAWQVLARGNIRAMPTAVAYQRNMLDNVKRQAEDSLRNGPNKALLQSASPKQLKEALTNEMSRILNQASTDPNYSIKPAVGGVIDNPYHRPSKEVMEKIPEARKLKISKILEDHQKNFPDKPATDEQVLALAYENIGPGKAYATPLDAAKDISLYYRTAVNYNNENMRFDRFGLPAQESYMVKRLDYTRIDHVIKHFIDKMKYEFNVPGIGRMAAPGEVFETVEQKEKKKKNPPRAFDAFRSQEEIDNRNKENE